MTIPITRERARFLRRTIDDSAKEYSDTKALTVPEFYPIWKTETEYVTGDRIRYESVLYKCLQGHVSQANWSPDVAPSLWVRVDDPSIEWPEWRQPSGSTDAYMAGDKVTYQERHWISDVDNNVWIPGVYGWTEAA